MSDGEQEFDLKKKKKKSKKVDFDAFEEDAAGGNDDGVAATAEKIEDLDRAFLRLCSFSLSLSLSRARVDDDEVFSTAFIFREALSFFFVYARAFESNEGSRRRFDAIAQRKSAGFVRLLHRFSMDGWMDARASLSSFLLSLSLSLPLSLRANFISLTLFLSLFRPSFLPNKQTNKNI